MKQNKIKTLEYYNLNFKEFIESTLKVDMTVLYSRFLPLLPKCGSILDVGCGPGRDIKCFLKLGYSVEAFDGSEELVRFAKDFTGIDVKQSDFINYRSISKFDGIWACASLLHLPSNELKIVLANLSELLKKEGLFYVSFKYGAGQDIRAGRYFNFLDEVSLSLLLEGTKLIIKDTWISNDLRSDRDEKWLNAILVRG